MWRMTESSLSLTYGIKVFDRSYNFTLFIRDQQHAQRFSRTTGTISTVHKSPPPELPNHRLRESELTVPVLMSLMQLRRVYASSSALPELRGPPDRTREADHVCGMISADTCNDRTITDDRLGNVLIADRWSARPMALDSGEEGCGPQGVRAYLSCN